MLVVQAGSLIATAWLVWKLARALRLYHHTLADTLVRGVACPVIAWVWAAAITFALYYTVPEAERDGRRGVILRTATTAVWFGPAMVLLSEFSPAALLAALVLVVQTSRLLYAQWQAGAPRSGNGPVRRAPYQPGTFAGCQLPPGVVWSERGPALAAAVTLQGGVAAAALNLPVLGTGLLCLGTALLTVYSMVAGAGRPLKLPHSIPGVMATVLMAVVLTLAGALGYGADGLGPSGDRFVSGPSGFLDIVRTLMNLLFYEDSFAAPANTAKLHAPRDAPNTGTSGGFPGVILWPAVSPVVKLIAPIPAGGGGLFHGPHPQPLSIPFSGEYWMFRWPFAEPPRSSYSRRGNPLDLFFKTTDQTALQMLATHKLDTPIQVDCCSAIRLEITNADPYAGATRLEMDLLNNAPGWRPILDLGAKQVTSTPDFRNDPVRPVHETLEYPIPETHRLTVFDEFRVVFLRRDHCDKSAKISVERFVLMPRE